MSGAQCLGPASRDLPQRVTAPGSKSVSVPARGTSFLPAVAINVCSSLAFQHLEA